MRNRRRRTLRLRWPRRSLRVSRRTGWALTAASCCLAVALALWHLGPPAWVAVKSHPYFALAPVELSGNRRLSRDDVLKQAGITAEASIWEVSAADIRMRLERDPWVERVAVVRQLPRRLAIRLRERSPVAIVALDGLQYVDRTGRILGSLREEDSRDLPIITGIDAIDSKSFGSVALHRALQLLRWCERLRCFDTISEVRVDRVRGITVFPMRSAVPVVLGWGSWREKLGRSARVFAAWEGQTDRLEQVDVSYRNQIVVRLRQDDRPAGGKPSRRGTRV